jgi:osmotically-inducible protein OsmY
VVTLRGTVASLRHKQSAGAAAARVRGVIRVADDLTVRIPDRDRRDDENLRGDVLEALMLESSVPMTVDAQASDGVVTLTGTVEWQYQRQAAESRTASVPGVACIDNAITLAPAIAAGAVADAIRRAFRRDAVLDTARLSAEIGPAGRAILSGTVGSLAARDRAVAAAWSAAGVVDVDDRIGVEYAP